MVTARNRTVVCPCGSGEALPDCCLPYIRGERLAASAEILMRSRYCAYALGHEKYLLDSWHHSTRPQSVQLDASLKWLRLKIIDSESLADEVEFIATYKLNGKAHKLREKSRFVLESGEWFYLQAI